MLRTFVYFDASTIDYEVLQQIYSTNSQLQEVEQNICVFEFDAITFAHALMLLGQNGNRFGYDLSLYLSTVVYFFNNSTTSVNGLIIVDQGSSDFKKRISEDLGVAISSLFMAQSFQIKWETITQIPQNKKLSKKTPDFLGFNLNDERYIYESKGTTQPQNIESAMTKALEQSKGYPETATGKFAIVSYFPTGGKSMPPFTFIADPPISDIFIPERENSILLHYTHVLSFAGLDNTLRFYENLLVEKFKLDRQDEQERTLYRFPRNLGLQRFLDTVIQTFEQERVTKDTFAWRNITYIGRYLDLPDGRSRLFTGVHVETIEQILRLDTNIQVFSNTRVRENGEEISTLSDGTIFKIQAPDAENQRFPAKPLKFN
ncbi:hypothetical protein ANSO36C_26210 [Nostoc cf. commune SO-36]|uniref:Uncharacterized protein n=1 Tax=Nostoc cf. commune SO-36 TaxID=449208 RepID=A0ABM7Z1G3_NOSCO|nr:hypothetical protein [Nostoc commune]BDI16819.1 hypothetical protein ANSO36C_26210 [Nostoc cf. commune SO-36]